ncbi:MAG: RNA pseudouridine synthase [Pedosphaera sp.]|nr:RNA pseudouridine synthase [Pedosphaera sp.]
MSPTIKLSSTPTHEFWEIPVLFEDELLLALDKPAGLLVSPEAEFPERPDLMTLLHAGIAAGKPWAVQRQLTYLSQAHHLDGDTSGVLLLAKSKPALATLGDLFGIEKPAQKYVALVHGAPKEDRFEVNAKLAPHPLKPGMMRVDPHNGKKAQTVFEVIERFTAHTLICCRPLTSRAHQLRVHLQNSGLRIVGDELYGGAPLLLSRLKKDYRLKHGRVERPLLARVTLHAEELALPHPVTGETVTLTAPWPKDLRVALKYLREFGRCP